MVNGDAVGFGCELALCCDMRTGSENTRLSEVFTKIGFIPGGGGTWLLPRLIGIGRATEIIFTGRFVEAEEAYNLGILNKLVPPQDLNEKTMELARSISALPPLAIRLAKMNIYKGLEVDLPTAIDLAGSSQVIALITEDRAEAVSAFREKRPGIYKGK